MDLNDIMEFDHVVQMHWDGTVTDAPAGIYAPNLHNGDLDDPKWTMLNGWSGQHFYSGPVMHDSESIRGALAQHILDTPGIYVAVAAYWDPEKGETETLIEGWAVARFCTHSWVSGMCGVHTEDLASVYEDLRGTGQKIECEHCETRWRPGVYAGE